MSIIRQQNWLGQQRIDVPHLRSLESSIAADFDVLAGQMMAGQQPLVVKGLALITTGAIGSPATSLVLNTAGGLILHPTASESGTIFTVSETQAAEVLNSTNPNLDGNFTPNTINYIGLDLKREADSETADLVAFLDANTLTESIKTVPLARILKYRIIITTNDFSILPNVLPIAKVTTDATNKVTAIADARNMLFRLGVGGSVPNNKSSFVWTSRLENTSGDVFAGGDKEISSFKDFADAVMTRLWEIGGGEYWYRPNTDREVKLLFGQPVLSSNNDNFAWDLPAQEIQWSGLSISFANSTATYNTVASGQANLNDGQCLYVDVDRANNGAILTPQVANLATLGWPTTPGSRHVIAWRQGDNVFIKDKAFEIGRSIPVASTTVSGTVRLSYTPGNTVSPIVVPLDGNGAISVSATANNANAIVGTGFGTGSGVRGVGGSSNGTGISAMGGGVSGTGIYASSNINGIAGWFGVNASGTSPTVLVSNAYSGTLSATSNPSAMVVAAKGTVPNLSDANIAQRNGIVSLGNSTGVGIRAVGGATGAGVVGVGGSTSGAGVTGTASAGNSIGVDGAGNGTGAGVRGTGGATGAGVVGVGGSTSGAGVTGTASAGNSVGVQGTGNGTGAGVSGTGGATGNGLVGVGGSTSGAGVTGTASAGNSVGVQGTGNGTGAGVRGTGGATGAGVVGVGGSTNGDGIQGYATATAGGAARVGVYGKGSQNPTDVSGAGGAGVWGEGGAGVTDSSISNQAGQNGGLGGKFGGGAGSSSTVVQSGYSGTAIYGGQGGDGTEAIGGAGGEGLKAIASMGLVYCGGGGRGLFAQGGAGGTATPPQDTTNWSGRIYGGTGGYGVYAVGGAGGSGVGVDGLAGSYGYGGAGGYFEGGDSGVGLLGGVGLVAVGKAGANSINATGNISVSSGNVIVPTTNYFRYASAVTKTLILGAADFVGPGLSMANALFFAYANKYWESSPTEDMWVAANPKLPEGSEITAVDIYCEAPTDTAQFSLLLLKQVFSNAGGNPVVTPLQSTSPFYTFTRSGTTTIPSWSPTSLVSSTSSRTIISGDSIWLAIRMGQIPSGASRLYAVRITYKYTNITGAQI